MTEVTLNANINVDICSIPSKFHMLMSDGMKKICIHKISEAYLFFAYEKLFITNLLKYSRRYHAASH